MACSVGTISGRWLDLDTGKQGRSVLNIGCGKWVCEDCRKRKAKRQMARALQGGLVERVKVPGFREEYNYKLLTLTCPGKEYRETHTTDEAYKELQEGFAKLRKALRHRGWFEFLRVVEAQRDGFPHYHVLLAGQGIRRKEILREIVKLWRGMYGLGFVKLNALKRGEGKGVTNAIKYLLKYLFKGPFQGKEIRLRIFASSRHAMKTFEKAKKYFNCQYRANTSVEYVVLKELKGEFENGIRTFDEEGNVTGWELVFERVEGCPF